MRLNTITDGQRVSVNGKEVNITAKKIAFAKEDADGETTASQTAKESLLMEKMSTSPQKHRQADRSIHLLA